MKALKKLVTVLLVFLLAMPIAACGGAGNRGDDVGNWSTDYDPDIDSWKQLKEGEDEDIDITWFNNFNWGNTNVEDLIYKRTGVRIHFQSAMTSDNSELTTMIAGNRLPDVITLSDLSTRVQLVEEGYCYAINKLAESYAPSLLKRLPEDELRYYSASDGNCYGLASNYYSDADLQEADELGSNFYMNYNILVRKDYLNAYLSYKSADSSFDKDRDLTKPQGFLDMCKWIKAKYNLDAANPTVMFSTFPLVATNDDISNTLSCLMEMFCVPYEDGNGDLVYQFDTEEFQEVICFLNDLWNAKLVSSSNFSWDSAQLGTQILNGRPAVFMGASQNLVNYLSARMRSGYNKSTGEIDPAYEYVGVVLTNSKGDAPLLCDYAGRGYRVSMITRNCKRPDRVIKVIDYLMSEQGQRELYYGEVEGEYYNFKVRPGEVNPDTGKTSTYGIVEWTDKAKALLGDSNANLTMVGLKRPTMLQNQVYMALTSDTQYQIVDTLGTWIDYQSKCLYFDYTFRRVPFRYPLDTSNRKNLSDYAKTQAKMEAYWIEALPKMIMAKDNKAALEVYRTALSSAKKAGADKWLEFRNKCFKAYKQELGITYAWPKADPNYVAPEVKLFGSVEKHSIEMPDWIKLG